MRSLTFRLLIATTLGVLALVLGVQRASAATFTFTPTEYDNTQNTVPTNDQTTGLFRDVFWWRINNGVADPNSADYINAGPNLVGSGGSPSHAYPGGNDQALNFTGPGISGGMSYLTVYDATVADGTATRSLFDANAASGGLTLSVDVLFAPGQHSTSGGIATLFIEGNDGLAMLLHNGGGNNADNLSVDLFWTSANDGTILTTAVMNPDGGGGGLPILGDTVQPDPNTGDHWYRLVMTLSVTGGSFTATGWVYNHTNPEDPNSALGALLCPDINLACTSTVSFTGSLSNPGADGDPAGGSAFFLTNPGEIGLIAQANEDIDSGCPPSAFPNLAGCTDNVGVSFTNFTVPTVPEPGTIVLLGSGLLVAARLLRRR